MFDILDRMEPLGQEKNPTAALILGFFCGGIGLGIYFRSLIDAIMPLFILVFMATIIPAAGVLIGACLAAVYGYLRAVSSNKRLR